MINAKSKAKDGDFSALKIFYQKRLAQPWGEHQEIIDTSTKEISNQDFGTKWNKQAIISRSGEILTKEKPNYKKELLNGGLPLIFMSVDVQKDSFYYVIRGFGENPQEESMLIECGQLFTWADVFAKRAEYLIPNSHFGVDSGYRTQEIYALSAENRFFAMKGHPQRTFKREITKVIGKKIYESHAVASPQTVQIQTQETLSTGKVKTRLRKILLLNFSSNAAKDWIYFNRRRTQRGKSNYNVPNGTPDEYNEQMNAEKRIQEGRFYVWRPRKQKVANHFLDCETMIYALCLNTLLTFGNNSMEENLT